MKAVVKLGLLFIFQLIRAGDISKLIKDCGSEGAEIQSISMEGCDGSLDFCQAPKGSTVKGKMTFKSKSQVASLQCKIYGKIFGLFSIPFPGGCPGSQDACKDLSRGNCPIEKDEEREYNFHMNIKTIYPNGKVGGKWTLKSPEGTNYICFEVPIKIVS